MKTFALYVCVLLLIYFTAAKTLPSQSNRKDLDECINNINITSDEMFRISDILHDTYKQPGNEEKVRKHGCIFQCVLEKVGAMEGSEVIVDKMHNEFRKRILERLKDKAVKMVDNCLNTIKTVTEKCQKAFDLVTCLLKAELEDLQRTSRINEEHTHEDESITPAPE